MKKCSICKGTHLKLYCFGEEFTCYECTSWALWILSNAWRRI